MEKIFVKILCLTDFTSASANALKEAAKLVSTSGAKLFVTHIIVNRLSGIYKKKVIPNMRPDEAIIAIKDMVNDFAGKHVNGASYDILVKEKDNIYEGIIEYAKENDADLIVMAADGPKGFFARSVTEKVVCRAPCSVLVVR